MHHRMQDLWFPVGLCAVAADWAAIGDAFDRTRRGKTIASKFKNTARHFEPGSCEAFVLDQLPEFCGYTWGWS
ncbi:MAG: hypothetical protein IT348_20070 [Candidatus Eisenbacteria bacterium]|nr:hypothetical protein [Candidatus Eisenbacteria bacterium]